MSGIAALLALRDAIKREANTQRPTHTWSEDRQHIVIGQHTFYSKSRTPYKIKNKNEYYPLDSIVSLLDFETKKKSVKPEQWRELKLMPADYLKQSQPVSMLQQSALLSYLRGEVPTTVDLDIQGLERLLAEEAAKAASGGESKDEDESGGSGGGAAKRQRIGEADEALKAVADWTVEDILAEESQLSTHLSVLQVPKKNFSNLVDLYHKAVGDSKSKTDARELKAKAKLAEKNKVPVLNPKDPNYGVPIIVVPAALSAVINMYNAKQLLENGIFESGEYMRVEKGVVKEPLLTLNKASFYDPSKNVRYQIVDDVTQLKTDEDWHRVVAVFVQGPTWQFADWPKKKWNNPAAIFENVCAFHLHFDDEALHANIAQWRTHRLPISKNKRHGDRSVVLDFWHILNEFIAARNTTKKLNI